jgi:hypothetical protein
MSDYSVDVLGVDPGPRRIHEAIALSDALHDIADAIEHGNWSGNLGSSIGDGAYWNLHSF